MSKNLTRKGLAFGALIALGSTVIAGAPAFALDSVQLAPAVGSTYAIPATNTFDLKTILTNSALSGTGEHLKFLVTDASKKLDITGGTSIGDNATQTRSDAGVIVVDGGAAAAGTTNAVTLTLDAASDVTFSVTVQAWVDFNDNGEIDTAAGSEEAKSVVRTVKFIKSADAKYTTTLTAPTLGDSKLTATVTSADGINLGQLDAQSTVQVAFAGYNASAGTKYTNLGAATSSADGVFTAGEDELSFTSSTNTLKYEVAETVAAGTYAAVAVLGGAEVGATAFSLVASRTVDHFGNLVLTKTVNTNSSDQIRVGATSAEVTVQAYKDGGTTVAASGIAAKVTITENIFSTGASLVAGGKTLAKTDAGSSTIEFTTTTNADGKVVLPLTLNGFKADDSFDVIVSAQGRDTGTYTYVFKSTAAASLQDLNVLGANGAVLKVATGSTYSLKYAALDNFGQLLSGKFRVVATQTDGTDTAKEADLVGGIATISETDSADLSETYTVQLQKWDSVALRYVDSAVGDLTITPVVGSSNAAAKVTSIADEDVALNLADLKVADERLGQIAGDLNSWSSTITGVVTDAAGVGTYANVTISAPGVLFETYSATNDNYTYTLGSTTVQTDASGAYGDVWAYSNTSGKVTVTVTAGAASEPVVLNFAAADDNTGTALAITAPAAQLPGKTFQVSATLKDKYGNAVATDGTNTAIDGGADVSVTYTGPGIVTAALPAKFDTTGSLTFSVLLAAGDAGTGTVTIKYDANGDNDFADTGDIVKTATIVVAPVEPSAIVNVIGHRVYVKFNDSKGEEVSAVIGGVRITKIATYNGYVVSRWIKTPGKYAVKAYVAGDLVKAATVTVK